MFALRLLDLHAACGFIFLGGVNLRDDYPRGSVGPACGIGSILSGAGGAS